MKNLFFKIHRKKHLDMYNIIQRNDITFTFFIRHSHVTIRILRIWYEMIRGTEKFQLEEKFFFSFSTRQHSWIIRLFVQVDIEGGCDDDDKSEKISIPRLLRIFHATISKQYYQLNLHSRGFFTHHLKLSANNWEHFIEGKPCNLILKLFNLNSENIFCRT